MLWNEYEVGIGGVKPTNYFTKEERGADGFNYSKRNIFWSLVAKMMHIGRSAICIPMVIDFV